MATKKMKDLFPRLGEIVVRKKLASPQQVDAALTQQRVEMEQNRRPLKLGELLIQKGILDRADIREILEEQKIGRGEKKVLVLGLDILPDHVALITMRGRLDQHKCDAMARVLERLMDKGIVRVILDCKRLVGVDNYGLSALAPYIDETRLRSGDVKWIFTDNIQSYLDHCGFSSFVDIQKDVKSAQAAFKKSIDGLLSRGTLGEVVSSGQFKEYHLSYCKEVQGLSIEDRTFYQTKRDARLAGKAGCDLCLP